MSRRANKSTPNTQQYLPIAEIKDDTVILKDGTVRAVMLVSSINFALKSDDEQNAIVAAYIGFLNFLDGPLQIVIQSRKLNLDGYLADLQSRERLQTNDLLKLQTAEYRNYITELVELGDIMTKRFYVVVSFDPATSKKRGFFQRIGDVSAPTKILKLRQKEFEERRKQLLYRVDKVLSSLSGLGLRASVLDTQSLIELFYTTYNPVVSRQQPLADINKLTIEEV